MKEVLFIYLFVYGVKRTWERERRGESGGAQRLAHTGRRRVEERALVKEGSGKKDRKGWDSEEGYLFGWDRWVASQRDQRFAPCPKEEGYQPTCPRVLPVPTLHSAQNPSWLRLPGCPAHIPQTRTHKRPYPISACHAVSPRASLRTLRGPLPMRTLLLARPLTPTPSDGGRLRGFSILLLTTARGLPLKPSLLTSLSRRK